MAEHEANNYAMGVRVVGGIAVILASTAGLFFGTGSKSTANLEEPRWFSDKPGKRWTEKCFLWLSVLWISWFGLIVVTGAYEWFEEMSYMVVCLGMALPYCIAPLFFPGQGEPDTPLLQRTWVKANVWIIIISYVGNYFWTHYFFNLLGAAYTFKSWRINNVPICLIFATHAYFAFYHTFSTLVLRRLWTSHAYQRAARWVRPLTSTVFIFFMAYATAFMETLTIASFPYYTIKDRFYMYSIGSICYGIYFIFSFPMYYRLDETSKWTVSQSAIDSLAGCMLVTIMLDLWRLSVGGVLPNTPQCVPYM